jgi:hypothetical protein
MAKKKTVVFTFGRFQPPTIGHEKLINAVIAHAKSVKGEHRIYASQTYDGGRPRAAIKNPLQYNDKIKFLKKMFPQANIVKGNEDTNTFMRVLYQLQEEGYTKVHIVVGGDRVAEIKKTVKPYLNSSNSEEALNFEEFKVVSAGKRDPEAEGVVGMSASKMRAAVAADDIKTFKKGLPKGFAGAEDLFNAIKKGMERPMKTKKIKAEFDPDGKKKVLKEKSPPDEKSERFIKKTKDEFKDRYGDDWASYLYGTAWKQYNKRHGIKTKTRLGEPVEEETLHEGGVKGALEDWLYDLPKPVIEKIKNQYGKTLKKAGGDIKKSANIRKGVLRILKQGNVKPLMGSMRDSVDAVLMSFDTFHGDLNESLNPLKWKPDPKSKEGYGVETQEYRKNGRAFTILRMSSDPDPGSTTLFKIRGEKKVYQDLKQLMKDINKLSESVELNEGIGNYQLKKISKKKADIPVGGEYGRPTVEVVFYEILKDGKKVGHIEYEDYFGSVDGELHGKPLPMSYPGSDPKTWLHKFLKSSRGKKFVMEAVSIPRRAEIVGRNKEEKTVMLKWHDGDKGWQEVEVPEDEVPGFYDRATDPMKKRKTDKTGKALKKISKSQEKKISAGIEANKETAEDLVNTIEGKPMGTVFTIFGTKQGKKDEYSMKIQRRKLMGKEVYIVKSSGRQIELRPAGTGLQIIDTKTKKMLLDRGRDMTW